ncbi:MULTISPECIES: septum formation family protein [Arthrobacter]|uniref:septum formation family protein n=1 Tax=Arthrobacter TaxID=1663 RepID=UPI0009F98F96|nr:MULTISPECIES: septum formation family protein [Arthrobacter]UPO77083.1 septum formation family protein [Arthrobacter sp. Helios]
MTMYSAHKTSLSRAGRILAAASLTALLAGCAVPLSSGGGNAAADEKPSSAAASPTAEKVVEEVEDVSPETVDAIDLNVGDCLIEPDGDQITEVDVLPCTQEHDSEVYAAMDMAGSEYPGETAVDEAAAEFCVAEFQPYIGADYQTSVLDIGLITPTSYSWTLGGDREILCTVYRVDGSPLTNSVRNAQI